jgi:murein DD-endopeptidase MepM/ murein hydrolase activator NlpD
MTKTKMGLITGLALVGLVLVVSAGAVLASPVRFAPPVCDGDPGVPCAPGHFFTPDPDLPPPTHPYTTLANPALGQVIAGTDDDRLAGFSRRPLDHFIIPEGGLFLDPLHDGPHYGVDYANPDDYLVGTPTYFYPIGPGYVTTQSACVMCFIDSDQQGQVDSKAAKYNFGWGGLVLIETPYSPDVSIYVLYAHLDRDFVNLGDYVTPDHVMGIVGSSGYSQEAHLHLEVRYGAPGRFWKADFSQQETLDRWLSTPLANPAMLIFPENHWAFTLELDEWAADHIPAQEIP